MQAVLYRQFFRIEAKDIMLNIVLVEPEIPMNTGNIARTCAATRSRLHLVGPLGFDISDRAVKRAGLDYWHMVDLRVYDSLEDLFHQNEITDLWLSTTKAPRPYTQAQFRDGCYMTEVVLHRLTTLTREDLNRVQEHCKENILELLDTYDLTEYAVVEADLDWKYSEAALEAGPQLDEGRYLRYFLLARTENVPEYRYYELFWDDFLV